MAMQLTYLFAGHILAKSTAEEAERNACTAPFDHITWRPNRMSQWHGKHAEGVLFTLPTKMVVMCLPYDGARHVVSLSSPRIRKYRHPQAALNHSLVL